MAIDQGVDFNGRHLGLGGSSMIIWAASVSSRVRLCQCPVLGFGAWAVTGVGPKPGSTRTFWGPRA